MKSLHDKEAIYQFSFYFTNLLGLEYGPPSRDCLSDLYAKIDSKKFMAIFIEWIKDIVKEKAGKKISVDSKTIRSATDKIIIVIFHHCSNIYQEIRIINWSSKS